MSVLPINEEMQAQIRKVIEHASAPDNHYYPERSGTRAPGTKPEHVAMLHQYRCVFSVTRAERKTYRHLSISVGVKGKFPHPIVAFTIARMFGFTGWNGTDEKPPRHWGGFADKQRNCIVLIEEFTA